MGEQMQTAPMCSRPLAEVTLGLPGGRVRLEPTQEAHVDALFALGPAADWAYMSNSPPPTTPALWGRWMARAWAEAAGGTALPFTVVVASGNPVGVTRYMDYLPAHRLIEIGATWLSAGVRGSGVNAECKLLLLEHAFEALGVERVQLKCDLRNERSQRAIERIGAVREGVLRRHRVCWDGFVRDTVMYSVVRPEWAGVKRRLEGMLGVERQER